MGQPADDLGGDFRHRLLLQRGGETMAVRMPICSTPQARRVVEPFVDAHVHLDYSNTVGRPRPNESGTLFEAIEIWAERKEKGLNDFDEIYRNALAAARSEAANGTGFIRYTLTSPIPS